MAGDNSKFSNRLEMYGDIMQTLQERTKAGHEPKMEKAWVLAMLIMNSGDNEFKKEIESKLDGKTLEEALKEYNSALLAKDGSEQGTALAQLAHRYDHAEFNTDLVRSVNILQTLDPSRSVLDQYAEMITDGRMDIRALLLSHFAQPQTKRFPVAAVDGVGMPQLPGRNVSFDPAHPGTLPFK